MGTHAQPVNTPSRMDQLMTVGDAAEFFSVSRRQIYLLVERDELPAVRVGTRIRFIPEEVRGYLERHREGPGP